MASLEKIREQFRKILQLPNAKGLSMAGKEMETAFLTYMRRACDTFDLSKNIEVSYFVSYWNIRALKDAYIVESLMN